MTGYEKSPDYGGPEPTKPEIVIVIAVMIVAAAVFVYVLF